jgi:hypothetical protein
MKPGALLFLGTTTALSRRSCPTIPPTVHLDSLIPGLVAPRVGQRLTEPRLMQDCPISDKAGFANEKLPKNKSQNSTYHIDNAWLLYIPTTIPRIPAVLRFPATVPAMQQHFGEKQV